MTMIRREKFDLDGSGTASNRCFTTSLCCPCRLFHQPADVLSLEAAIRPSRSDHAGGTQWHRPNWLRCLYLTISYAGASELQLRPQQSVTYSTLELPLANTAREGKVSLNRPVQELCSSLLNSADFASLRLSSLRIWGMSERCQAPNVYGEKVPFLCPKDLLKKFGIFRG